MNKEEYIDHELRIRMMEHLNKQLNQKLNALITITITGFLLPLFLKHFGV